jgi:hypothetical protein
VKSSAYRSKTRSRQLYENYHTIDWQRDLSKDKLRHKWLVKEARRGQTMEKIQAMFDACSGCFNFLTSFIKKNKKNLKIAFKN